MRTETKTIEIYKFNELSKESQQHAIERLWNINVEHEWYDYDGLLDLTEKEIKDAKITNYPMNSGLISYVLLAFDFERGNHIEFDELKVNCEETFRKFLRIDKTTWNKIDYEFIVENESTSIEFSSENTLDEDLTQKQLNKLDKAKDIFDVKVWEALNSLRNTYEYLTSKEAIIETIEINEYEFTKDGELY